ncbi:GNAT family N-acetyltransferase [Peterkaempfera griseoplana]|uniref:GNAT family N-acetyltransferase n=1 Tax=Peterkaempfera griseoplana TaxID=66896 RepID=UPI0006E3C396|nr:GNAT family N-acetyltransferase [Peterkaempfera griseoplana]
MDQQKVLALFDERMRRNAQPDDPAVRIERTGDVVRQVGASADDWNGVLWSGLDEATADAAIAAQVAHFTSLGREFEWKLYTHDLPADLSGRLLAAGFSTEPAETLMVAEIEAITADAELPDGVRLQPVVDASGVELAVAVHEQAFETGADHLRHRLLSQLGGRPETFSMAVAMAGDVPVCAARMELHPGTGFASLWGGGTVPAWRGRGIYRALVAHRARIAAESGCRYLQVDASSQSRPILQRLGFTALSTTVPHVFRP